MLPTARPVGAEGGVGSATPLLTVTETCVLPLLYFFRFPIAFRVWLAFENMLVFRARPNALVQSLPTFLPST
jgi:hypothetical protein